jgi:hypothetical protein
MVTKITGVPYHSQFKDVPKELAPRACTMACLRMAMEFMAGQRMPCIGDLYVEALAIQHNLIEQGTITGKAVESGLLHDVIVNVAHNYGVPAHKEEFKARRFDGQNFSASEHTPAMYHYGLKRIYQSIRRESPVIVSVKRDFDPAGTNHSVLIIGCDEGSGFTYLDPDTQGDFLPREDNWFVSLAAFKSCWRRLAIFVDKVS